MQASIEWIIAIFRREAKKRPVIKPIFLISSAILINQPRMKPTIAPMMKPKLKGNRPTSIET